MYLLGCLIHEPVFFVRSLQNFTETIPILCYTVPEFCIKYCWSGLGVYDKEHTYFYINIDNKQDINYCWNFDLHFFFN